jgi:hypothetical protein
VSAVEAERVMVREQVGDGRDADGGGHAGRIARFRCRG